MIFFIDTSSKLIHDLIIKLHDEFTLKKMGTRKYFYGIEVKFQSNGSLFLTHTKYIKDLISKVNMTGEMETTLLCFASAKLVSIKLTNLKILPCIDQQLELCNMSH